MSKRVAKAFDHSSMSSKSRVELRKSITQMKKNREEVEQMTEQRTGKKSFKLDQELLGQNFTPYKLRLIEKSIQLQNNAIFLKNFFHTPGSSHKAKRPKSRDEMISNIS